MPSPAEILDELTDGLSELAGRHNQSIPKQEIAQLLERLGFICDTDKWEEQP